MTMFWGDQKSVMLHVELGKDATGWPKELMSRDHSAGWYNSCGTRARWNMNAQRMPATLRGLHLQSKTRCYAEGYRY